ncbi:tetratricopeptide repeat protein [Microbaculum marinum]|uniref:Ancillary SecYEG translocon subunit n=1 Tax=Microbaculum marinum TaxID=1764581 RepID=A0AAW9RI90_9HYPH
MSDIFREVEEDVRREQLKKLWDRYGIVVIAVAALIVLGTAGWRGWQWYSERQAAALGAEYYEAVQLARDQPSEAEAAFNEIAAKGGGFAALARLRAAAARAEGGDLDGAVSEYDAISSGSGVQTDLRDVARIRAGYILLQQDDRPGVEQRVGDLAAEGNPWRNSARELLGLAAYQDGDTDTATARFEEILGDNETPSDMRARAQLMISLLAADRPMSSGEDAAAEQ